MARKQAWKFVGVHKIDQYLGGGWRAWLNFDTPFGRERDEVSLREAGTGWIAEYNGFWKRGKTRQEAARRIGPTVAAKRSLSSIERAHASMEPHARPGLAKAYRKRRAMSGKFPVRIVTAKAPTYAATLKEAEALAKDRAGYHGVGFVIAEDTQTGEYVVGTLEDWRRWKRPEYRRKRTVKVGTAKQKTKKTKSEQATLAAAIRRAK